MEILHLKEFAVFFSIRDKKLIRISSKILFTNALTQLILYTFTTKWKNLCSPYVIHGAIYKLDSLVSVRRK